MNSDKEIEQEKGIKNFARRMGISFAQTLYSRKTSWRGKIVKSVVYFGVSVFQKRYGFMKDDIIDADIGFTAEELDAYQYGDKKEQ